MDWKNTIAEIQRLGQLTQAQIAQRAGCGQATVSDLANATTKQPSYALGCALIDILEKLRNNTEAAAQGDAQAVGEQGVANV